LCCSWLDSCSCVAVGWIAALLLWLGNQLALQL